MKKVILSVAVVSALLAGTTAKAQLIDEQNVTVTMDLQPILQLNMNGSQNIDFVFDQISEYVGGITQYGATNLQVSSSVSWDLYAAGFSSASVGSSGLVWDNQVVYGEGDGSNAVTTLPMTLLELHQDKDNSGLASSTGDSGVDDYFTPFQTSLNSIGANNIYATSTPYARPAAGSKYIAGGNASSDAIQGGTYLVLNTAGTSVGAQSLYSYTIDYRIIPGLPAVFPRATDASVNNGNNNNLGTNTTVAGGALSATTTSLYARPGVYTMNVKYILVEN
jgi:hypothetical protein